jgi:hypothetical protein
MTKENNLNDPNAQGSAGEQGGQGAQGNPGPSAAELQKQNEKLAEELRNKDRLIQEQGTTIQTFKKRSEELGGPVGGGNNMHDTRKLQAERERIYKQMEEGDISVTEGNRALDEIRDKETEARIRAAQHETFNQTTGFLSFKEAVERIKRENPEVVPFEDFITGRANDLLNGSQINPNTGSPYTPIEAAQAAVSSFKARYSSANPRGPAAPGAPAPGAAGEGGENRPPAPAPTEKPISDEDSTREYVNERQAHLNRIKNPTYRGKM